MAKNNPLSIGSKASRKAAEELRKLAETLPMEPRPIPPTPETDATELLSLIAQYTKEKQELERKVRQDPPDSLEMYEGEYERIEELGRLIAALVWQFGESTASRKTERKEEAFEYEFRQDGDFWRIVFRGEELPRLKLRRGVEYIGRLLQGYTFLNALQLIGTTLPSPGATIVESLRKARIADGENDARSRAQAAKESSGFQPANQLEQVGMFISPASFGEHLLDPDYMKQLKEYIESLESDREEADKNNDVALVAKLQYEKDKCLQWLKSQTKYGSGRDSKRDYKTLEGRARGSVRKAIYRAIEVIRKTHPVLGKHLHYSLKPISYPFNYKPSEPIEWMTKGD